MQGFVFSVLRVLFGILDSAQFGFGVSGVFWFFFERGEVSAHYPLSNQSAVWEKAVRIPLRDFIGI